MGNTLKSVVAAIWIFWAWQATPISNAQENINTNTRDAVSILIDALDSARFAAAKKVFEQDRSLISDGMTDEEKQSLAEHAKKLIEAKIAITEAQAVLETLREENIIATKLNPDLNTKEIPIDETREEKEERMLNEKTLSDVNDFFQEPENWIPGEENTVWIDIKTMGTDTIFTVRKNWGTNTATGSELPSWYVSYNYGEGRKLFLLPWNEYIFSLGSNKEELKEEEKTVKKVRLIFFDREWGRLGQDGKPNKSFALPLVVWENLPVKIPLWCSCVSVKVDFTLEKDVESERYKMGEIWVSSK